MTPPGTTGVAEIGHRAGMSLVTRLTEMLGLRTSIAQAGMAFIGGTPELTIAVSNAGGLGSLGVGRPTAASDTASDTAQGEGGWLRK